MVTWNWWYYIAFLFPSAWWLCKCCSLNRFSCCVYLMISNTFSYKIDFKIDLTPVTCFKAVFWAGGSIPHVVWIQWAVQWDWECNVACCDERVHGRFFFYLIMMSKQKMPIMLSELRDSDIFELNGSSWKVVNVETDVAVAFTFLNRISFKAIIKIKMKNQSCNTLQLSWMF